MPNKPKKKPKVPRIEFTASSQTLAEVGGKLGIPIRIVEDAEAENSDIVICVYAGQEQDQFKADNIYTTCADCGKNITHRPHAPKKPAKVCMPCAVIRMQKDAEESCDEG